MNYGLLDFTENTMQMLSKCIYNSFILLNYVFIYLLLEYYVSLVVSENFSEIPVPDFYLSFFFKSIHPCTKMVPNSSGFTNCRRLQCSSKQPQNLAA